jgi:hypothetical protein
MQAAAADLLIQVMSVLVAQVVAEMVENTVRLIRMELQVLQIPEVVAAAQLIEFQEQPGPVGLVS